MIKSVVFDPLEWTITRSIYTSILPNLSYSRDYQAAELAGKFCNSDIDLLWNFNWDSVSIVMPPAETKPDPGDLLIAIEGYSTRLLRDWGLEPHIVVTDLDFVPEELIDCDCLVLAHAHGDNIDYYPRWASRIRRLIPTVQVWPRGCSLLIPGFTDGDRAVYLAYYMGARRIRVYGFNPRKVVKRDDEVKRRKLEVAEVLISRVMRRTTMEFYP